jgi:UDP-N-acetylmuramoyl-L-alanyl-D-glutamate--2,6-diaminopimelate ligase
MKRAVKDILYKVSLISVSGNMDVNVNGIFFDSRLVCEGSLFVATIGTQVDGHQYIEKAIEKGALAIVCQTLPSTLVEGVTYAQVTDSSSALGILASNYYGNPSSKLKLVGVTGTNCLCVLVTIQVCYLQ